MSEKFYVNAYEVVRCYGGAEEGGWWYNHYECIETVPCKLKYAEEIKKDLEKEYDYINQGDIYSVLGGTLVDVRIEKEMKQIETRERPRWE